MNVKLQWYPVKDGQVDLPLGAQSIEVRFEDPLGMGGGEQPVAVLVQDASNTLAVRDVHLAADDPEVVVHGVGAPMIQKWELMV